MTVRQRSGPKAFTLVEVIIFVAVLSLAASAGIMAVKSSREAAKENKLGADTAHVNEVLQIYLANGGTLPASYTSTTMMALLKARADAASASKTMGLSGSYLDVRTVAVDQTAAEAASPQVRAVWTGSGYTVQSGPGPLGIKEFNLNEGLAAAAPTTNSRDPGVLPVDTGKKWIWDYTDQAPPTVASGTTPSAGDRSGYVTGTASTSQPLSVPAVPNGAKSLISFNGSGFPVTLTGGAGNPSTTSQIYYATSSGGSFAPYMGTFYVDPGTTISAYTKSLDLDHYSDSSVVSGTITATPITLFLNLAATGSLTYAQAGGAMTSSSATAPNATVGLVNDPATIPVKYLSSGKFQTYYSYGASSLSAASVSFSGTFVGPQITLNVAQWASGSNTLQVNAQLRSLDTNLFTSSTTATINVNITPTILGAPSISPPTGQRAATVPVVISLPSGNLPVGARIYYTLDTIGPGATAAGEPSSSSAIPYSGSFSPPAGTNGGISVTAQVYGPTGFGQWFTPSNTASASYTSVSFPDGALVGSANLNGTFVGSLVYASPTSGSMGDITFNGGAKILKGNLYLPGTPTIKLSNGTTWSTATDSSFSAYIQGWEFDADGNETVQTTPRVIDDTGSAFPKPYTVQFNNSALLEGKIVRKHNAPAFPTVAAPPPPDSNGSVSLNSHPTAAISASGTASITNNTSAVGDVSLNPGNFYDLQANNGTSFVLGDALHPDVTQVYSVHNLTLNSGGQIKIVGKVILTVSGDINLSTTSVLGNSAHSDWLQLQMSTAGKVFQGNSGSSVYAELVNPTGGVTFNKDSVFHGSVTALTLTINSNGIVFDQPPVIQN